jgi:hypothetical protein
VDAGGSARPTSTSAALRSLPIRPRRCAPSGRSGAGAGGDFLRRPWDAALRSPATMLFTAATLMVVSPAAAAAASVVAVRAPVPADSTRLTSCWPAWSMTMSEPAGIALSDASVMFVSPAATSAVSVVGVSDCE